MAETMLLTLWVGEPLTYTTGSRPKGLGAVVWRFTTPRSPGFPGDRFASTGSL